VTVCADIHACMQVEYLTKGDNNRVDDRGLYAPGQNWLKRDDILGEQGGREGWREGGIEGGIEGGREEGGIEGGS
jgi:hypothetical protein